LPDNGNSKRVIEKKYQSLGQATKLSDEFVIFYKPKMEVFRGSNFESKANMSIETGTVVRTQNLLIEK